MSPPTWRSPRLLVADGWRLFLSCLGEASWLALAAAAPPIVLTTAALRALGLDEPAVLEEAVALSDWGRLWPLVALSGAGRIWTALCALSVLVLLEARRRGETLTAGAAISRAAGLFWPFLLTALRALLWIAGGLLLFVVPGILFAVRFALSHLAVPLEGLSGAAALSRSRQLMALRPAGALGRLLAAALASALALLLVTGALELLAALSSAMLQAEPGLLERQFLALTLEAAGGLSAAWFSACAIILYHDLESLAPPSAQRT